MSLSLSAVVMPTYQQILPAVLGYLEKGRAHYEAAGEDVNDAVQLKLIADMQPLHFQMVSVVHHSMNALISTETGNAGPPDFSLAFDYAGLTHHVQTALDAVNSADLADLDARADSPVVFRMGSREMPFTATNYLLSFSLPNFYFHATTGYDLLRMQGGLPVRRLLGGVPFLIKEGRFSSGHLESRGRLGLDNHLVLDGPQTFDFNPNPVARHKLRWRLLRKPDAARRAGQDDVTGF